MSHKEKAMSHKEKAMDFTKLLALAKLVKQFIRDFLAIVGTAPPPGAQAAYSEMHKAMVDADALFAECDAVADNPKAQKALGDRLKNLLALLKKFLGDSGLLGNLLGGILGNL